MKLIILMSFILLLLSIAASACLVPSSDEIEQSCSSDSDCPKGMVCKNEECITGQDAGDNSDKDTGNTEDAGVSDAETKDDGDEQTDDTGNTKDTGISDTETKDDGEEEGDDTGDDEDTGIGDADVKDEGGETPDTTKPDDGSAEDTGDDAETGEDSSTCENECTVADAQECVGSSAYKVCQPQGECLKWSETMPCGGEQKCRGEGKCGKDECEKDKKQCNSKIVQECKDEDSDLFYEWVGTQTCQNACENGLCVGCTSDSSCSTPTPRCYTTDNTCVECLSNTDCTLANSRCETRECVCVYAECGAVCCPQGYLCYQNACCTSNCTNKCGGASDGCGGTCTTSCGSGKVCQNQACVACGGSGQPCCDNSQCTSPLTCGGGGTYGICGCTPNCTNKCGGASDGCGGTCSASCDSGKVCQNQACVTCGASGQPCCDGSQCTSPLTCGGGGMPSVCGCTPNCTDKCGGASDGCGGTCNASCGSGKVCQSQACVACGASGQPCCDSNQCDSALICFSGNCLVHGSHIFSKRFGSTGDDISKSVSTDSSGNVFVTGQFQSTINFGGNDLASVGSNDIFLAKYDPNGNHIWSKRFGSTGNDVGLSVSVDSTGNVFIIGGFNGTVNFGGGDLTSAGDYDIFLTKFDPNGSHIFSKRFGSTGLDYGTSVFVDSTGNVFVTGYFEGTVNFGGSDLTSAGNADIFLAKYDSNGNHIWSKRFGSTGYEHGNSVSADSSGNVFVTGYFSGAVNFGGDDLTSAGGADIFLTKFDSSGNHIWSKRFGSSMTDYGNSISVNSGGNVFVTGSFGGTVNFGGSDLISTNNSYDIFLAKYDSSGNHIFSKQFGSTSGDYGYSVAVDDSDNVFVTGYFMGTVNFGGSDLSSAGYGDVFIAKYDSNDNHIFSKGFGSTGEDSGYSVSTDSSGSVFVTGSFKNIVNFGGSDLTSAGNSDIFLIRYSP